MNFIQKAILRACWQEEDQYGRHAPRPWLDWFLTRVVETPSILARKSERIKRAKEQRLALCREQALRIDPETAEVYGQHGNICDPYGFGNEDWCVGYNCFARSPGSDVWVSFDDLPQATCDRLRARMKAGDFRRDNMDEEFI
jgi:hypothetical protein